MMIYDDQGPGLALKARKRPSKYAPRKCLSCPREFQPTHKKQRFCDQQCYARWMKNDPVRLEIMRKMREKRGQSEDRGQSQGCALAGVWK